MMTMLVIFLLMSFSATGEILFVQKNIVLPDAQNWTDLERAPVIGVSKDVVTLDGSQVATADELMKDSATGDFKIAELHDKLVTLKNNYKLLHPSEEFNGIAIVQSDKNVEFKVAEEDHVLDQRCRLPERQLRRHPQGQGWRRCPCALANRASTHPYPSNTSGRSPTTRGPAVCFSGPLSL